MKKLIYQVCVGKKSALYKHCTASVEAYAKSVGADYICQTAPILMIKPDPFTTNRSKEATARLGYLPIFEKENALEYLGEYEQVAIIDADVWIRTTAGNIFNKVPTDQYDFGGVLERDMPLTPQYNRKVAQYSRMQYGMLPLSKLFDWKCPTGLGADFYNMGIMVCNIGMKPYMNGMSAKDFITQPEFKPFVDGVGNWKWSTDQTLLNYWVKKTGMRTKNLSYHFNALYKAIPDDRMKQSHFVHFFLKDKLPDRGENVEELMKSVM